MFNTAFSYTKSKWKRWPVVEVDDIHALEVLEPYKGKYPYVWLKSNKYEILDTFNWSFFPDDDKRSQIHAFPICVKTSKRPVTWDALRLVPTTATDDTSISKCQQIAGYIQSLTPMFIYGFDDKQIIKKYNKLSCTERPCHLVRNNDSFDEIYSLLPDQRSLWLINADVVIHDYDLLNFDENDADVYMFDVMHQSTGLVYADQSVQMINPSYLNILQGKVKRKPVIKHVKKQIGSIVDSGDPFRAWANAYYTCLFLKDTSANHLRKQKNKILGKYIQLNEYTVNQYASAGVEAAERASQEYDYDFTEYTKWKNITKRFMEWKENHDKPQVVRDTRTEQRLDTIRKIYGENSEEYQKLSSQLDKSAGSR